MERFTKVNHHVDIVDFSPARYPIKQGPYIWFQYKYKGWINNDPLLEASIKKSDFLTRDMFRWDYSTFTWFSHDVFWDADLGLINRWGTYDPLGWYWRENKGYPPNSYNICTREIDLKVFQGFFDIVRGWGKIFSGDWSGGPYFCNCWGLSLSDVTGRPHYPIDWWRQNPIDDSIYPWWWE